MWVLDATNPTVVLGGGSSCSRSHLKTGATQYTTHLLLWYLQLVPLLEARRAEQVDKLFPGALELGLVRRLPRGGQTKHFLYGAPKNHDHYGLSILCMDKH